VAGHDDREGVAAQRGAHAAGVADLADGPRDLAVGDRPAGLDLAGRGVDPTAEIVDPGVVEGDVAQVAGLAVEERDDALDRACDRAGNSGGSIVRALSSRGRA
jgi:hypothetical protein